jgi:hypothetical protein
MRLLWMACTISVLFSTSAIAQLAQQHSRWFRGYSLRACAIVGNHEVRLAVASLPGLRSSLKADPKGTAPPRLFVPAPKKQIA